MERTIAPENFSLGTFKLLAMQPDSDHLQITAAKTEQ